MPEMSNTAFFEGMHERMLPPSGLLPLLDTPPWEEQLESMQSELFFASLICHVDRYCRILRMPPPGEESGVGILSMVEDDGGLHRIFHPLRQLAPRGGGESAGTSTHILGLGRRSSLRLTYGPSALPLLDAFIESICQGGGVQGRIRSWAVDSAVGSGTIIFNIKDNRSGLL